MASFEGIVAGALATLIDSVPWRTYTRSLVFTSRRKLPKALELRQIHRTQQRQQTCFQEGKDDFCVSVLRGSHERALAVFILQPGHDKMYRVLDWLQQSARGSRAAALAREKQKSLTWVCASAPRCKSFATVLLSPAPAACMSAI